MTNAELEKLVEEQAETIRGLEDRLVTLENKPSVNYDDSNVIARLNEIDKRLISVIIEQEDGERDTFRTAWVDNVLNKYHANDKPAPVTKVGEIVGTV